MSEFNQIFYDELYDEYCELYHKAKLFAELYDYEFFAVEGHFEFYNSPNARCFNFNVNSERLKNMMPLDILLKAFNGRLL